MARKYDASSIIVLENDRDKVRNNPSMYIPDVYKAAHLHLFGEIFSNSLDEVTVKGSVGNRIDVTFDEKTKEFSVRDDGSGVPLEKLLDVLTKLAASGKFHNGENSAYLTTAGRWGHGLKTAVFLSKHCEFTSMRDGKYLTYVFEDGNLVDTKKGKSDKHGTYSKYLIDPAIIDSHEVTYKDIYNWILDLSYIYPSVKITLTVYNAGKDDKLYKFGGKDIQDRIEEWKPDTPIIRVTEDRPVTYLKSITDDKMTTDTIGIDICFAFKEAVLDVENKDEYIISYANAAKTYAGGTHNDGLKLGIQKYFKEQVIPKFKGKDKDLPIMPSDMIAGLCAFITVKVVSPIYMGQEKNKLSNQEVKFAVRDAVYDALCAAKSNITNPMIDFVKRVTRGRMASKKTRKKDVSNPFSKDRLEKFKDVEYNLNSTDIELLCVEGDSAADNAATARDPNNQAIYPIKRPANIYDMETERVNKIKTTFNDVLDICGLEAGKKCEPEKSTMNRILMLTDGDVDGDDISNSMVCLLAKHCRPLIDAGMVGRILPPAYSIPAGNGKKIYVRSQREFFDKITKKFIQDNKIGYKGKEFSKKDLRAFLEKNFEYDIRLDKLAKRSCCDPIIMEYIAWVYHGHVKDQKKSYWMNKLKQYNGLSVLIEDGEIVLDGDIPGYEHINIGLDEYFDRHVHRFKKYQSQNDYIYGFEINGEKDKSVYEIMHLMRTYIPKGVERFKGLGELSPDEMHDLCMDKEKRTVIIFKFKDFEKDMDKIDIMMSTNKQMMQARQDLIFNLRADEMDIDT